MVNNFTVTFENLGFKTMNVNDAIVRLHGNKEVCNSMLAAIEKCVSEDLSPYIDSRDKEFGIQTDIVRSCSLTSDIAEISLNVDSAASNYKGSYYRVIRAVASTVRITETPIEGGLNNASPERKKSWELAKKGYPIYSEALRVSDWIRLTRHINNLANEEVVSFNSTTHELVINKALITPAVELAYMLFYEAFFRVPENCHKIFLLPEMPMIKAYDIGAFIDILKTGVAVDSVFYIRDSSYLTDAYFMRHSDLEF